MSKQQKKKKPVKEESSEENDSQQSDQGEDVILTGGVDQMGGYDDSQFQEADESKKKKTHNFVHLKFQQRTARKCLTLVEGLPDDLDLKKIIREFKRRWCCNGTCVEDEEYGTVIQLQGDHRREILKFLIEEGIAYRDQIKVHGY